MANKLITRLDDLFFILRVKKKELYEFFYFRYLKHKLKPSDSLKLDYCKACGYCCYYSVCVATPDELVNIADFLNLHPVDFILEKCAFAHYHKEIDNKTICIVYPRFLTKSMRHKAGTPLYRFDFFDVKGCIFLTKNNKCAIYPVRPVEARLMRCWKDHKVFNPIKTWDNDVLTSRFGIEIARD
jgi:Fe-S-cluster containining protein